ncbi:MptD family putative ECF transporter S component [Candidatus Contubernalis alkaliaceticus]|uniref:MptD family putative ECF transporter S component n=1 Tax=Candidatus Contubernalis alkaliaceticus TaxID=338645 RepID=UPI001F4C272C|nr:MptD family putative ECF transporter S component [Candidatus Contubernalis alkalaceticus]UNC93102.1 MptD family putative ECF transporter S component [Candidatus Contubernalis alkalaceticus]
MEIKANVKLERLQVRDLISLGVLNAVFIVIFFAIGMTLGMIPLTYIFMPAAAAVPLGVVFMLIVSKVPKKGAILISGIVQGAVFLLLGSYWPMVLAIMLAAAMGEFIAGSGVYKSFAKISSAYALLICGYFLGAFIPVVFFAERYREMTVGRGYEEAYIDSLISLLNAPLLLIIMGVSAVGAVLGAFLGKRILKKHFLKAGIV